MRRALMGGHRSGRAGSSQPHAGEVSGRKRLFRLGLGLSSVVIGPLFSLT